MDLRDALAGVAQLGYEREKGMQQPAQKHLREVRAGLTQLLPPLGWTVRVSGVAVNLPRVPWIAVLNPEVTTRAQSGLYVCYLYDAELERVFLTMNQGATAHREQARPVAGKTLDQVAVEELLAESLAIRAELPASLLGASPREIDLKATGFLPQAYEAGSIAAEAYELSELPAEEVLRADLDRFLSIYDAAVDARTRLTALDPNLYRTPAVKIVEPSAAAELFRPKDSSDYVAQITARTQVRTRRHEAVVKAFGEHSSSKGWTPSTNVHPRDLVLRKNVDEVLCEIKVVRANAEGAVREAIGQLFTYRYFLYTAPASPPLLAVFSDPIGDAFVQLLAELGISSVWSEGGDVWAGSAGAVALGLI